MKRTWKELWEDKLEDSALYFGHVLTLWATFSYDQNIGFAIAFTAVIFKLAELKYSK